VSRLERNTQLLLVLVVQGQPQTVIPTALLVGIQYFLLSLQTAAVAVDMVLALLGQTVVTEVLVAVRHQVQQVELEIRQILHRLKEQTVVMAAAVHLIMALVAAAVHLMLEQQGQRLAVATAVMELQVLSLEVL
jgi:hypothetical protein